MGLIILMFKKGTQMESLARGLLTETKRSGSSGGFSFGFGGSGVSGGVVIAVLVITFIVATLLFIFVVKRKKSFNNKFANWLKEYLNFRSIVISSIVKYVYLFLALFLTIMSFIMMFGDEDGVSLETIITGLAILVLGNIFLRIMLELTMSIIMIWENSSSIRTALVEEKEKEEKESEQPMKDEPKVEQSAVAQPVAMPENVTTPPQNPVNFPPQTPQV